MSVTSPLPGTTTGVKPHLVYVVNVDWYFRLHWLNRAADALSQGFRVSLICNRTSTEVCAEIESRGIRIYGLDLKRSSTNPAVEWRTCRQLFRMLRSLEPDLIHAITIKPHLYAGWFARRHRYPFVATVAGLGSIFTDRGFRVGCLRRLLVFLLKRVHRSTRSRVIFENRDDLARLESIKVLPGARSVLIRGAGVDPEHFRPATEATINHRRVLFAGRLLESKGLSLLVDACDALRLQGVDIELAVAGITDTDQRDAIPTRRIREWADSGRITWLGEVREMAPVIQKAAIVALPTRYGEGIPRILIEAACCAKALIATDVPGCREIVESGVNGLLIPAEIGADSLGEVIGGLLEDPVRLAKFGRKSREIAVAEFADEVVLEKTRALYRELL